MRGEDGGNGGEPNNGGGVGVEDLRAVQDGAVEPAPGDEEEPQLVVAGGGNEREQGGHGGGGEDEQAQDFDESVGVRRDGEPMGR